MIFKDVTRGGQTSMHMLRMLKQISNVAFMFAILFGIFIFAIHSSNTIAKSYWLRASEYIIGNYNLAIAPKGKEHKFTQVYHLSSGQTFMRSSASLLRDPKFINDISIFKERMLKSATIAGSVSFIGYFILIGIWSYIGNKHRRKKHERGSTFLTASELAKLLKIKKIDSSFYLDKLPLVKDKETAHMLITGTTGAGKSNCFNTLLPQIRLKKQKAIVIDITGEYISKFYNEKTDIILNPLDTRSAKWHIWAECNTPEQYDTMASSLIQENKNIDAFWINNSRTLFTTAAFKLKEAGITSTSELIDILIIKSLKNIQGFFKTTRAASIISDQNEKTSISIRATLAASLKSLDYLEDTKESFSIREWVEDKESHYESSWLFLTCRADQRETLKPLLSCFMDTAINSLMTLDPDSERRLWFIIDELAALNKLPSLPTMLAEGRKYGGCVLIGTQSVPQINEIYGYNLAQSLLDLFNTRVFFRSLDPTTAAWVSKCLGEAEQTEPTENMSYGAHEMRDGVSLSQITKVKPLVMPTEISKLEDLEAYIQLPGVAITKMKFTYKTLNQVAKGFILNEKQLRISKDKESVEESLPENKSIAKTDKNIEPQELINSYPDNKEQKYEY